MMKQILLFICIWTYLMIGAGAAYRANLQHPDKPGWGLLTMVIAWPVNIGVILMVLQYESQERIIDGNSHAPKRT